MTQQDIDNFKKVMVIRFGVSDEDTVQFISDMVDNAVGSVDE